MDQVGISIICFNSFERSLDCIEWLLMSKPEKRARFLATLAVTAFEGDPTVMTNVHDANPALPPNEDHSKLFGVNIFQKSKSIARQWASEPMKSISYLKNQ